MPKKPQKPDPDPEQITDDSQEFYTQTTEEEALVKISETLDRNDLKDGDVMVFRTGKGEIKPVYMGSMPVSEFGVDEVVGKFGGGKYLFKFRDRNRNKIITSCSFAADYRLKGEIDRTEQPAAPPPPPVTDSKDMMTLLMSMLAQAQSAQQKSSETLIAVVTAAMSRPEPATRDPWLSIAPVISAVTPFISKAMENKGPIGSIKEVLDLMKHAKEIGGDSGGESDGITGIISTIGNLLAQRAQAQQAMPMPAPNGNNFGADLQLPLASGHATATDHTPTGAAPNSPMTIEAKIQFYGKMQLGKLARAAQRGVDPVSYADVLLNELDDLDPAYAYALADALKAPDWMQRIFGVPAVPFQPWFDQLREALLEEPLTESEGRPASAPAATEKAKETK